MGLYRLLRAREEEGRPLRVGLIGAGKFGAMFLAQALRTPGLHVLAAADLCRGRALDALRTTGWPEERIGDADVSAALGSGRTAVTEDPLSLIAAAGIDVVVEATGDAAAGIAHALACFDHGRHVVMVTVEADVLAGPLLARRAVEAGVVYSLAYGDQPALICELVDWARTAGFEVAAAGKGTLYMPDFHASTPDTVWARYGITRDRARARGLNPKMFNSFLDGTKSAIEMAAVANATGLTPAPDGGVLHHKGQVEVVSSRARDGRDLDDDLRWGVYVTFEASSDYVERCFADYGIRTDASGRYAALWRPYHLIGLELGISVARAGLRGEATGTADGFRADVVAAAKRDLAAGEMLDGEGGYTVCGRLMPADASVAAGALPIGLAHGMKLRTPVAAARVVHWSDIQAPIQSEALVLRREMESLFFPEPRRAHAS